MSRMKNKHGFTLVELSLAIVFIAILLMTIAIATVHITAVYRKGMTIKNVNSVGRDLIDDFKRTISGSKWGECEAAGERCWIKKEVSDSGKDLHGAFCTGDYSYIWNTGYAIKEGDGSRIKLKDNTNFILVKVSDSASDFCDRSRDLGLGQMVSNINLAKVTFLLEDSSQTLALYDFDVNRVEGAGNRLFYDVDFTLGTIDGTTDDGDILGANCEAGASDSLSNASTYCAVNKFNFAVRAAGGTRNNEN